MIIGMAGFIFVLSESLVLTMGWNLQPNWGMQFHRSEQIGATILIFAIPFFLHYMLEINPLWKIINRIVYQIMFFVSLIIIIIAFIYPDLFVSVSKHRHDWLLRQADYGRGQEGYLYIVRDVFLGLLIIYALVSFITDMILHKRIKYLILCFVGLLMAMYGAVIDVTSVHTGKFYDFTPDLRFGRFNIGITLFILFSMNAVLRKYFDIAKESQIMHNRIALEADKNQKQNDFIKNTLKINSVNLYSFSEKMSGSLSGFIQNSQDQAAAIEEVSASIEELSAGTENVKLNLDRQFDRIATLSQIMITASDIMKEVIDLTQETLVRMQDIFKKAQSGDASLALMSETMGTIAKSSSEINGISAISDTVKRQAEENNKAVEGGNAVSLLSEQIKIAMDEQKSAISEIAKTVSSINELAQENTAKGLDITEISRALVGKVQSINKEIDEFSSET